MGSKATRALFRQFMKVARQIERDGMHLELRMPVDREAWLMKGGSHNWGKTPREYRADTLRRLLPWVAEETGSFTPALLREHVRAQFRAPPPAPGGEAELLDRGFASLRILLEQIHMAQCSSSASTDGVHVEVTTAFVGKQADLDPTYEDEDGLPPKLLFTYRVRVSNVGSETVQLQARHWLVEDDQGKTIVEVPRGSRGVLGCTPLLKPDSCFEYYSGLDLEGGKAAMRGSFQMAVLDARQQPTREFDALIAPFRFVGPKTDADL